MDRIGAWTGKVLEQEKGLGRRGALDKKRSLKMLLGQDRSLDRRGVRTGKGPGMERCQDKKGAWTGEKPGQRRGLYRKGAWTGERPGQERGLRQERSLNWRVARTRKRPRQEKCLGSKRACTSVLTGCYHFPICTLYTLWFSSRTSH